VSPFDLKAQQTRTYKLKNLMNPDSFYDTTFHVQKSVIFDRIFFSSCDVILSSSFLGFTPYKTSKKAPPIQNDAEWSWIYFKSSSPTKNVPLLDENPTIPDNSDFATNDMNFLIRSTISSLIDLQSKFVHAFALRNVSTVPSFLVLSTYQLISIITSELKQVNEETESLNSPAIGEEGQNTCIRHFNYYLQNFLMVRHMYI
jgi:hypothetical protein